MTLCLLWRNAVPTLSKNERRQREFEREEKEREAERQRKERAARELEKVEVGFYPRGFRPNAVLTVLQNEKKQKVLERQKQEKEAREKYEVSCDSHLP